MNQNYNGLQRYKSDFSICKKQVKKIYIIVIKIVTDKQSEVIKGSLLSELTYGVIEI